MLFYASSALAGAKFITDVRGLPLSDLDIECGGHIFHVICKRGKCGIVLPKFPRVSSFRRTIHSIDVRMNVMSTPLGQVRIFKVGSVEEFSNRLLPELSLSFEGENVIGTVVFDKTENIVRAASHFCVSTGLSAALFTALCASSYLFGADGGNEYSVCIGEMIFDVRKTNGSLLVFDRHIPPLTLYAPDIE